MKRSNQAVKKQIFCSCLKPTEWRRRGHARVSGLSCLRCRVRFYTQRHALWSEWNLCSLSCESDQTSTLRSAVIGNRFVWDLGCEGEWGGVSVCRDNICFKATRGPCLCVWPCISKVGWSFLPWTTRRRWHQQEEVMLKHSPVASRKEQHYPPESHLHSLTKTLCFACAWCTNAHSQTHKLMLLCWAPHFLALGLGRSTGVQSSGLHECNIGSAFRYTAAPAHTYHDNYTNVQHGHTQTQAKMQCMRIHKCGQMQKCLLDKTHRNRCKQSSRLYLYKQRCCWNCAADMLFSFCASVFFFLFCGLKQQLSHSRRCCCVCLSHSSSQPLSFLFLFRLLSSFAPSVTDCPCAILSALCNVSLPIEVSKQCSLPISFSPPPSSLTLSHSQFNPSLPLSVCSFFPLDSFSPSSPSTLLTVCHWQELPKILHPCSIRRRRRNGGRVLAGEE